MLNPKLKKPKSIAFNITGKTGNGFCVQGSDHPLWRPARDCCLYSGAVV